MELADVTIETTDFAAIAEEFHQRVTRMIWCNVATVNDQCQPRSRIMHPIWEGSTGWIGTWGTSVKAQHRAPSLKIRQLEKNPSASLAYIADITKPVYIDAQVEVIDDVEQKRRYRELARSFPEPYGHDPAEFFAEPDDPRFALLRIVPTRIALVDFPAPPGKVIIWRPASQ